MNTNKTVSFLTFRFTVPNHHTSSPSPNVFVFEEHLVNYISSEVYPPTHHFWQNLRQFKVLSFLLQLPFHRESQTWKEDGGESEIPFFPLVCYVSNTKFQNHTRFSSKRVKSAEKRPVDRNRRLLGQKKACRYSTENQVWCESHNNDISSCPGFQVCGSEDLEKQIEWVSQTTLDSPGPVRFLGNVCKTLKSTEAKRRKKTAMHKAQPRLKEELKMQKQLKPKNSGRGTANAQRAATFKRFINKSAILRRKIAKNWKS